MIFDKLFYYKIDGKFGFGHIHFNSKTKHTISYSTPFGTAIRIF